MSVRVDEPGKDTTTLCVEDVVGLTESASMLRFGTNE